MGWAGHYINLEGSRARRASIEAELSKAGIAHLYQRFPAIGKSAARSVLSPTEWACFQSHAAVLGKPHDAPFIHVLEDDAILSRHFADVMSANFQRGTFDKFDMIFTDVILAEPLIDTLRRLKAAYDEAIARPGDTDFRIIDLVGFYPAGSDSYFVNHSSLAKIRSIVRKEMSGAGPSLPIDLLYRREIQAGRIKAACIFPYISCVEFDLAGASTIAARQTLVHDVLRYAFYVDADLSRAEALLAPLKEPRAADRHLGVLADVQRILIAGRPGR